MPYRTVTVEIIWRPVVIVGCDNLVGTIDGVEVGYVGRRPDGRWVAKVMHRADWSQHLEAYVGSSAQARRMVERWLARHMPDVAELGRARAAWKEEQGLSPAPLARARLASDKRMSRHPGSVRHAVGLPG